MAVVVAHIERLKHGPRVPIYTLHCCRMLSIHRSRRQRRYIPCVAHGDAGVLRRAIGVYAFVVGATAPIESY